MLRLRHRAGAIHRPRHPAPTIRLRLTALYGVVFLITGAILLTLGYLLVRHNLNAQGDFRRALARLGLRPPQGALSFRRSSRFAPGSTDFRLAAAVAAQLRADALHRLLIEYLGALMAMTAVSVAAGWLLAGRALRPLRRITATARRVSGENLRERIALTGPADELKELADTFDGMLARLDNAFGSQRHFVANASHELRTPLAIMRTELDVALADPDAGEADLRRMGEAVRDTVDRCERLIESLLMLARSEAAAGREESVDVAALAADCVTDLRARAREADVRLIGDMQVAWVSGEPALLERMIANLIDNGIRYNSRGGELHISIHARAGKVSVRVANGGARIDPEDVQSLVEPFRRLGRGEGGFGLGLSIVRSVVLAHRGTIELEAPEAGGLVVRIELPAAPAPAKLMVGEESRALTAS
jgi:signal transduction histidine kinase